SCVGVGSGVGVGSSVSLGVSDGVEVAEVSGVVRDGEGLVWVFSVLGDDGSSSLPIVNPPIAVETTQIKMPRPPVMMPVILIPLDCSFRSATTPKTTATVPMTRLPIGTGLRSSARIPVTSEAMARPLGTFGLVDGGMTSGGGGGESIPGSRCAPLKLEQYNYRTLAQAALSEEALLDPLPSTRLNQKALAPCQ